LIPTARIIISGADHPDGIYHYASVNIPWVQEVDLGAAKIIALDLLSEQDAAGHSNFPGKMNYESEHSLH
jgi:hypothetical protein